MKTPSEKEFFTYGAKALSEIYGEQDYERILKALQETDALFQKVPAERFGSEYLCGRLALACHAWSRSCIENYIEDRQIENLLVKIVMTSFQSEKFLPIAEAFSEYLHAPEASKKPVLASVLMMIKRLGLGDALIQEGKIHMTESFQLLTGALDSFKSEFENNFFNFVFHL